jgi:hypothetical protein
VPDQYQSVRSLPFPAVASLLGIDLTKFKRRGDEWNGPCPIHGSKSNQTCFSYNDSGKLHCFSCDAKGSGAIDLTKLVLKIGFKEACEKLAAVKPSPATEKPATVISESVGGILKPLEKDTWRKFAVPCPWLEERIPDAGIRERYGVFCYNNPARKSAYSGRVMIPIRDMKGTLWGYSGRNVGDSREDNVPKYLFPKDLPKSHFLFGAYELQQHLAGLGTGRSVYQHVYLVESPFCVMKFASMGLPAVSPFGWSVSEDQLDILGTLSRGLVYLPDANKSRECGNVVYELSQRLWVRFPSLPDTIQDPEQMTKEQVLSLL